MISQTAVLSELTRTDLQILSRDLTAKANHRLIFDSGSIWLTDLKTERSLKIDRNRTVAQVVKMTEAV